MAVPLTAPSLSVVAAAREGEGDIHALLEVLTGQLADDVQVLVVDGGGAADYPDWVQRVSMPGASTPELWTAGLERAEAPYAALTTAALRPRDSWVAEARRAAATGAAVIGGAVEPAERPGLVGWSILFCRYAPHLLPVPEGTDPPGDNAVYRLDALRRHHQVWSGGFAEPFVHAALRLDGERLLTRSALVVEQGRGVSAGHFLRARFEHGRAFARTRSATHGRARLGVEIVSAPLVPAVMALRAARQVTRRRRLRRQFAAALPLVLCFFLAWAAGETLGRVDLLRSRPALA